MDTKILGRIFAGGGAIIGWFAIVIQFCLMFLNRTAPAGETVIRFFSYFTILTNILTAIVFTVALTNLNTRLCRFCRKPSTISAVTIYIFVVGAIYNLVLRSQWQPEGLQWLVDELLHTVIPLKFIFFWIFFVPKKSLQWNSCFYWLIYPLAYCLFTVVRGAYSGFYPYSFIDVPVIGYPAAIRNGLLILGFFFLLSILLIFVAKRSSASRAGNNNGLRSAM